MEKQEQSFTLVPIGKSTVHYKNKEAEFLYQKSIGVDALAIEEEDKDKFVKLVEESDLREIFLERDIIEEYNKHKKISDTALTIMTIIKMYMVITRSRGA